MPSKQLLQLVLVLFGQFREESGQRRLTVGATRQQRVHALGSVRCFVTGWLVGIATTLAVPYQHALSYSRDRVVSTVV